MKVYVLLLNCRKDSPSTFVYESEEEATKAFRSLPVCHENKYGYDQENSMIIETDIIKKKPTFQLRGDMAQQFNESYDNIDDAWDDWNSI